MFAPASVSSANQTRPSSTLPPSSVSRQPVNTQTRVLDTVQGRVLCIADIRGNLSHLNTLAADAGAKAIIHTGDFGFCEPSSLERINDRTLRHLIMYSPLITVPHRNRILAAESSFAIIREMITSSQTPLLSEFPLLLSGQIKLHVPVYTVWGACEDVTVLERFRTGQYQIENLHVIDEATTRCIDVGGVKLRLLGLGGALVPHKMFDNGDGQATIAGGQGTMWTTALQIGELVDTAQRVYDPTETRVLISHASPGREGLLAQLALAVKADLTISAGLHFRYPTSYNEFSVQSDFEGFRTKMLSAKENFEKIWDAVKLQVEAVLDDNQKVLLEKCLSVVERIPPPVAVGSGSADENAWKNCWNWNLTDAAFGQLVLDIKEGRVNAELRSQGFNYAYRRQATPSTAADPGSSATTTNGANLTVPGSGTKPPSPLPGTPGSTNPHDVYSGGPPKSSTPAPPAATANQAASPTAAKFPTPSPSESQPVNGHNGDKELSKNQKRKEKEKAKKAAATGEGDPTSPKPLPQTMTKKDTDPKKKSNGKEAVSRASFDGSNAGEANPASPGGADGGGGSTPTSKRPSRNPWTLFVKHLPQPVSEDELREFFGDAKPGIVHVKIPVNPQSKVQRHYAYVEFGDEEAMKAGLEMKREKIRDSTPHVSIAEDRETGPPSRGGRGGGRGGGFVMRGLQQAGLGRPPSAGGASVKKDDN